VRGHHQGVSPRAFASADELDATALADAPVRYPRPSRLAEPLQVKPARAAEPAASLGLHTVGDLLEHLPRDTGEARTIAALVPGETATVLVEVRSITSRPVRRRGMKPLVEATVADASGVTKATFFNQPWLERKYRPGTRLMLQGS
jgi:ATP-dependent DNA helicase RecG